jgi:hypothetical protein
VLETRAEGREREGLVVVLACVAVAFGASAAGSAPPREGPPDQIDHTNAAVGWDGTNYLVPWDELDVMKKTEDTRARACLPTGPCSIPMDFGSPPGGERRRRLRSTATEQCART